MSLKPIKIIQLDADIYDRVKKICDQEQNPIGCMKGIRQSFGVGLLEARDIYYSYTKQRKESIMNGTRLIIAERLRQIEEEGFTVPHDDKHINGELKDAAIAYAMTSDTNAGECAEDFFPNNWDKSWFKPSTDRIRNLTKAGALIAAEIDRLIRLEKYGEQIQETLAADDGV
jgi:hypothetical protein